MHKELEVIAFQLLSFGDHGRGAVDPGDFIAHIGEHSGMSSPPAGQIQHPGAFPWLQVGDQAGDKCFRFRLVAIKIEQVIVGGIEPVGKPWRGCHQIAGFAAKVVFCRGFPRPTIEDLTVYLPP